VPTPDDCYPWQPGGCEWTIRFLWRWMSSFGRVDVTVLALMLVYLFAVVIHVLWRYYLARRVQGIDSVGLRTLAAVLNIEMGSLKSVAITAPYLGLVGTCEGILSAFGGIGMAKQAAMVMIETRIAVALIPTAVAIPIAVLATCSYNYLRTRIELLEGKVFGEGLQRGFHFRGARRFPPKKRFSELPAFGLLAAPTLAFAIAGFMTFASFRTPKGFYVELPARVFRDNCGDLDLTILEMSKEKLLTINSKPVLRETLATRLGDIYRLHAERLLLVKADPNLSFQDVASIIDVANGSVKNLYVTLVTPGAEKEPCLVILRPRKPRAEPREIR
jgi:biopolymer transport protein ExbD